jgi:hypothetical protein
MRSNLKSEIGFLENAETVVLKIFFTALTPVFKRLPTAYHQVLSTVLQAHSTAFTPPRAPASGKLRAL